MRMKKSAFLILTVILCFAFLGCARADSSISQAAQESVMQTVEKSAQQTVAESAPSAAGGSTAAESAAAESTGNEEAEPVKSVMQMQINGTAAEVRWEDNESVRALAELAKDGLTIKMSMYGGFEQVGSIGQNLPRNDVQTTTGAGDIVLYSGNQIVVFYGSNSWSYTRLGHITDKTPQEMAELLGNGNVEITITAER